MDVTVVANVLHAAALYTIEHGVGSADGIPWHAMHTSAAYLEWVVSSKQLMQRPDLASVFYPVSAVLSVVGQGRGSDSHASLFLQSVITTLRYMARALQEMTAAAAVLPAWAQATNRLKSAMRAAGTAFLLETAHPGRQGEAFWREFHGVPCEVYSTASAALALLDVWTVKDAEKEAVMWVPEVKRQVKKAVHSAMNYLAQRLTSYYNNPLRVNASSRGFEDSLFNPSSGMFRDTSFLQCAAGKLEACEEPCAHEMCTFSNVFYSAGKKGDASHALHFPANHVSTVDNWGHAMAVSSSEFQQYNPGTLVFSMKGALPPEAYDDLVQQWNRDMGDALPPFLGFEHPSSSFVYWNSPVVTRGVLVELFAKFHSLTP